MRNVITKLFRHPGLPPRMSKADARRMYEQGDITWKELQVRVAEWSTDPSGRKFYYVCPKCMAPLRHCPDPACVGVGHHLLDEDWDGCDEDIPYATALEFYEEWCVDMTIIEQIHRDIEEAIKAVLSKYDVDQGGCEFHGELRGILQNKGKPETANGRIFQIGDGVPKGWLK